MDEEKQVSPRYLLLRIDKKGFTWHWLDALPYTPIRAMNFDDKANKWAEPSINWNQVIWAFFLIDLQEMALANIYMTWSAKFFVWWWRAGYGADGQPHIKKAEWIRFAG